LSSPVRVLSGVGSRVEARLQHLGIRLVRDLLFHLPYRYVDRTRLVPLGALRPGQEALVQGEVELVQVRFGRRRSLLCRISDDTGALVLRFFHFSKAQQAGMEKGCVLRCWGQARRGQNVLEMIHPEYQRIAPGEGPGVEQTMTPVYPSTEGLAQGTLRRLTDQALHIMETDADGLVELVPRDQLAGLRLPPLREALRYVHRPPVDADTDQLLDVRHPAQKRLAFEELLAHQLSLRRLRNRVRAMRAAPVGAADGAAADAFETRLPFTLTPAQKKVLAELRHDIARDVPMLRLVQGDVGSGKTVVAALLAVQTVAAGFQAAVMAPTELLAEQHSFNLHNWLDELDIPVVLLSGRLTRSERAAALERIADDEPLIAVGTHALFQQDVRFHRLGLVIIDEQHRFGVHQRLALLEKGAADGCYPHQLIMTATPIPRTLAMTMFADLDVSIIDQLPPGRQPVGTVVISSERRQEVIERIETACAGGRQVYWVCPLIEESESLQCQAAVETRDYLASALPRYRISLVHGRMKRTEKEQALAGFRNGETDVLVATTVIEVGVDVPNASLMIIENAERLGLAQLHQLRGRVGRGSRRSDCLLLYQPPLTETARIRLETMRRTTDGFAIAEKDLELRGPGELLGARQTGMQIMRVANLVRDARMVPHVQRVADTMLKQHPELADPLIRRWVTSDPELGAV
jgi:ATP-dependent DNA helicase RecG